MASAAVRLNRISGFVRFLLFCVLGTPLFLVYSVLTRVERVAQGKMVTPEQCYQGLYDMTGLAALKGLISMELSYLEAEVFAGGKAADPFLPFRAKLDMVKQIMSDFAAVADFVVVYVAEAHPTDGWVQRGNMDIKQHRRLEDRLAAAEMLDLHDIPCPILVDTMDNAAARAYAAMPDRLYIVLDGVCVYKGAPGPIRYHPEEVRDWLQKFSG
uniref:Iodothyronine deiodinase n=1 Tax=Branchiostoma floridae TaxID=7739 RepID=C4A0H0_BRAFL|eukprot:XP_002585701.1 hypothetical protein BRAFLDRAFT_73773 [Branchiostoma floridae]